MREDDPKRRPLSKRDPSGDPTRCGHWGGKRKDGSPCVGMIVAGTKRCRMHGGKALHKQRADGAVAVEVRRWGLGDQTVDPGVVLLRLVSQSAARVELYSGLLAQAFDAAERLRAAHDAEELVVVPSDDDAETPEDPSVQTARQDLRRIFTTGGVAALIGYKFDADRDGRVYAVEEAIRGLAKLEADERDRCASFATKAVAAGLAERQVRLAERQGALMAATFRGALDDAEVPPEVRRRIESAFAQRMSVAAGRVIEGSAA